MAALLALFSSFVFHGNDDEDDQETRILVAAFTMAVKRNDLDAVRQCLDKGLDIDTKLEDDKKTRSAFIYACGKNQLDLVKLCVERGANVYAGSSFGGVSGLDLAAKKGHMEVLKYLIEDQKMNPDTSESASMTPLHWACAFTQLDAAKYLISMGANIRRTSSQGSSIFSLACSGRNKSMMQWLLSLDIDTTSADRQGTCPIHIMAKHGPLDLLKLFIESGKANIQALDGSGRSAVDIADAHLMHEAALYLWELGVDRQVQKTLNLALRNTRCVARGPQHWPCTTIAGTSKIIGLSSDDPDSIAISMLDLDEVKLEPLFPVSEWKSQMADAKLDPKQCGKWIKVLDDGLTFVSAFESNSGDWEPCIVRADRPFPKSQRVGYFEIEILGIGERNIVTIGLTEEDTNLNHIQPGWVPRTYGFHGDDGAFFEGNGQGKAFASRWSVGDIIGCGVDYESGAVFFSRNGEYIGAPSCTAKKRQELYPTMGIENAGVEVRVNFGGSGPFRFNFEAPTVSWKTIQHECPRINKMASSLRLYAHGDKLLLTQDSQTEIFSLDLTKSPIELSHLETCKSAVYEDDHYPNFGSHNTCMDSSGNFWHFEKHFYTFGLDVSVYNDRSTQGLQRIFRINVEPNKIAKRRLVFGGGENENEPENAGRVDINRALVDRLHPEASANVQMFAEALLAEGDNLVAITRHPSLPNHIVILTSHNRIAVISFPTFAYKLSTLKGEMLPLGCTLAPLNDRFLAAVGGSTRSMRAEAEAITLVDIVACQTFTPEIVSDAVAACEACLPIAPVVSSPILTGSETVTSLPCIVELGSWTSGYDISMPVLVSQSAGDDLESLLRSNGVQLSDVEVEFADKSVLQAHRCVLWARCSSLKKQMEDPSQPRVSIAGNPRFARALVKYFYTNVLDANLIEEDSRLFVEFVQQVAPEHRQNILELLILTKPVTPSRIGRDTNQLVNNNLFSDIHLTVDGTRLAAHKSILIARSAYFSALLLGGLKESRMNEIPFEGVSFKSLEMIVKYLYTQDLEPILSAAAENEDAAVVPELFSLACQYGIRKLRRDLENILMYNLSHDNVSSLLRLADRHNALQLRARCVSLFETERNMIVASEDYIQNMEEVESILHKL
eukprot:TRINITY_DN13397_c0_g1_i1.p1 TRINITY_DN13397_c0_g1~~TRINITY_DN13397_c0_g1_i1.p1  ORF type:complete len:1123 (+),score=150.08 TRINITY_DN13397_c0_g1_i1:71-3439(+)